MPVCPKCGMYTETFREDVCNTCFLEAINEYEDDGWDTLIERYQEDLTEADRKLFDSLTEKEKKYYVSKQLKIPLDEEEPIQVH